jgi:hypothetical protein
MPDSSKIRGVAGYGQRYLSTNLCRTTKLALSKPAAAFFFNHLARHITSPGRTSGKLHLGFWHVPRLA